MSLELKTLLAGYFEATNAHHPDEVAALFSANGLVHDQGQDYRGSDAIRNWAEDIHRKFALRLSPADVLEEGEITMVRTQVAGAFLGSPIHQWYRFKTSENAIEELVIG
ncbi:MAG TPA: nuclear transport factor 2 family protein [Sphingomicrobium sp.]|nr:nuclear transport factor 2 family protein [Sphingomicrobium sp.]